MRISYKIKIICSLYFTAAAFLGGDAQTLEVISKPKAYRQQLRADSLQRMTELKSLMPVLVYDLRYATPDNFTGQKLYPQGLSFTFLRLPAARALQKVQEKLSKKGCGLKIFDAYRPYSATQKMWDLVHDERYVANPAKGSGHNRGLSVDLTIVDLITGKEVPMGTGFDHFSDTAHHDFKGLPDSILRNRQWLRETMEAAGFKALETEWWHYSWPNDRSYGVLNLRFAQLKKEKD